jgi:hypothetical protein
MDYLEPPVESETASAPKHPAKEASGAETTSAFRCYICGEPSTEICARCTRDTCDNHICERCLLCSDCCTCDERAR